VRTASPNVWAGRSQALKNKRGEPTEAAEDTPSAGRVIIFPGGLSLVPPHARVAPEVERRFQRLTEEWIRDTAFYSDPVPIFLHRALFKIIGMGEKALPLILKEMEKRSADWLVALDAVSPVNPVNAEDEKDFERAANAWIAWGRSNGLI
jgi:hypothetical protein